MLATCGANTKKCQKCGAHKRLHGKKSGIRHAFIPKPCEHDKLMANGRCNQHGGNSLSGPASPSFKHGRYSKALPKGLAARFEASLADPKLLELRAELALVDSRIEEVLGQVHSPAAVERWPAARAAYDRMRAAFAEKRPQDAARALEALGAVLATGDAGVALWEQLGTFIDRRARLVRAESDRLKSEHQMISVDRCWALIMALSQSVRTHVSDRTVLVQIQRDFRQLTGAHGGVVMGEMIRILIYVDAIAAAAFTWSAYSQTQGRLVLLITAAALLVNGSAIVYLCGQLGIFS